MTQRSQSSNTGSQNLMLCQKGADHSESRHQLNLSENTCLVSDIADLTHTVKNHGAQLDTAVPGVNSQMRFFDDLFKLSIRKLNKEKVRQD